MLPLVIVLVIGFLLTERRAALRGLVILLVAAAPIGWAFYQHHASGRFSAGTSFDGVNLHKGNNAGFLQHYPPARGDSIDWYDFELSRGLHFNDEWSFSDYHWTAALDYLLDPSATKRSRADLRKLNVIFFSVQKYGGTANPRHHQIRSRTLEWWRSGSCCGLRLRPPYTCLISRSKPRRPASESLRLSAAIFLAVVVACATPNLAGFAYTRHVSILIYPSALFCCRVLCVSAASSTTEE